MNFETFKLSGQAHGNSSHVQFDAHGVAEGEVFYLSSFRWDLSDPGDSTVSITTAQTGKIKINSSPNKRFGVYTFSTPYTGPITFSLEKGPGASMSAIFSEFVEEKPV